jgi:hypothetical protein
VGHDTTGHARRIVVGGSDSSTAALKWAITQAHLTDAD